MTCNRSLALIPTNANVMICGHTTHNQKCDKSFHCVTLKPDLFRLSRIRSQSSRDHDVRIKNAYKNKLTHE